MSAKVEAIIKPELLVWARESAGLSVEEAARKAQLKVEKLEECERGETRLTINQLRQLAQVYKRPLAVFYLPQPPKKFDALRDFRKLPGETRDQESPQLRFEIRRAIYRRNVALEIYREIGAAPPKFNLTAKLSDDFESVAGKLRQALSVTTEEQSKFSNSYEALNRWRSAIENTGVFVFQTTGVELSEMRGFSINEQPLPVIVINNKDAPLGRVFTMLHELTHLLLREGGVCVLEEKGQRPEERNIEVFCNRVAGATLVPQEALVGEEIVRDHQGKAFWPDEKIEALANRYFVSREALLRRLLILGLTTEEFYRSKRKDFLREYDVPKKKSSGGPSPDVKVVSLAGASFVKLVLNGYYQEKITSSDLADYLDMRLKHMPNVEEAIKRRLAS